MSRPAWGVRSRASAYSLGLLAAFLAASLAACAVNAAESVQEAIDPAARGAEVRPARRHEWLDASGRLHRSNLPPEAFGADGRPRPAWDPNHPASQQAALLRRLAEREQALRAEREAQALAEQTAAEEAAIQVNRERAMPRGRMGLGELLELEKNGGRPVGR